MKSRMWVAFLAAALAAEAVSAQIPTLPDGTDTRWTVERPDELVAYMRGKGYYATYGDCRLRGDSGGEWRESLVVDGLKVAAECAPTGPVEGEDQSRGMQVFFPPASSSWSAASIVDDPAKTARPHIPALESR